MFFPLSHTKNIITADTSNQPVVQLHVMLLHTVQVLSDDAAGELMPIVAGVVFTLTAHLSQSVLSEQQQGVGLEASSGFASITNSALHLILRKLLDFILCTG